MEVRNSSMFMDPDERIMAVLGKGYLLKFLDHGVPGRGFCVVTDKRMYFQGKCLYKSKGNYKEDKEEHIIDVREVIATGFTATRLSVFFFLEILFVFVWMGASFLGMVVIDEVAHYHFGIPAILDFFRVVFPLGLAAVPIYYYIKKFRIFEIEYSGGKIAFLTYYYSKAEIAAFQKNLYKVKDASALRA